MKNKTMKTTKTLLYFGAEWCSSCKAIKPIVEAEAPALGYEIEYIDLDTEDGGMQADEMRVRSLPTLILLDEDGAEIRRASGNTAWVELRK